MSQIRSQNLSTFTATDGDFQHYEGEINEEDFVCISLFMFLGLGA